VAPIRSFRKNLASSSSSKPPTESQSEKHNKVAGKKCVDNYAGKGLFVKINMDGVKRIAEMRFNETVHFGILLYFGLLHC